MEILKLDAIGEVCPELTTSIRSFITRHLNKLNHECCIVIETDTVNPESKIALFINSHQLTLTKQVANNITLLLIQKNGV